MDSDQVFIMDNQTTAKLNVHVEKETICGCTCTQYVPLPNKLFRKDGTWEKGKSRDQNLMCLGQSEAFLLKYRIGSVLTNVCADNGVSKVSLDITLNGILQDKIRYRKTSKYFHEIWVHQAENVNHCVALQFDHSDDFDKFDKTLSSILNELRGEEHKLEFEYRLVAFKPLHGKMAKTDVIIKSTEEICNEAPDPGPDPAPTRPSFKEKDPCNAQTALGVPFSPAPFTPPSDVLTLYKNKMILKKTDRFTFDSSELQCGKDTSKKSGTRRPINSDSSVLQKMPSLSSIKRECIRLSENECFDETIYTHMRESVSTGSENQQEDDSGNMSTTLKFDLYHTESGEQVKSNNESNELYENVFLPMKKENEVPLETGQSENSRQISSTDFNTTVFLPMNRENGLSLEIDQSQSSCQSSSTDFITTVFLPMNGENGIPVETDLPQSACENSSTDFNTTVFLSMNRKNNITLESEQSQNKQSDFNTTVFLPMKGSTNVSMATKQSQNPCQSSQTDFNSPVFLPTPRITKQNETEAENVNKSTDEENMLQQIKFLQEAINSCNKTEAATYAAELATKGVNVMITINRK